MFRGKESSNRIELPRLVQDLLNFGDLGSLRLWGWGVGVWGWGWLGVPPTHVHMHMHACTCTRMHAHAHIHVKHDNLNCKWLPPLDLGKSQGFPMMSYTCVHACAHVWGPPPHHPHPPTPHPQGGPPDSVKIQ